MNKQIDNGDHVLRIIRPGYIVHDNITNKKRATKYAFKLNEKNMEPAISVVWIEYYKSKQFEGKLLQAATSMGRVRNLKPNTLFAIGRVGDIPQFCMEKLGKNVRIERHPTRMIKSHARIYFPKNNDTFFIKLANSNIFCYRTYSEICDIS